MDGFHLDNKDVSDTEAFFRDDFDQWEDIADEDDNGNQDDAERFAAKRHPAILRVNHQVYTEASSLMYSDLEIVLQPEDVMGFYHRADIVEQTKQEWRRNLPPPPAKGAPYLEPYVFQRFQKIGFYGNFYFSPSHQHSEVDWTSFVDKDFAVSSEDGVNFRAFLRATRSMRNLAQLLSMNPVIRRLKYNLYIEPDIGRDAGNFAQQQAVESYNQKSGVAYERSIEIFLGAGMLDPLRELSNVETFQFVVHALDDQDKALKLQRKQAAMVWEVKKMLEGNYAAKQACLSKEGD